MGAQILRTLVQWAQGLAGRSTYWLIMTGAFAVILVAVVVTATDQMRTFDLFMVGVQTFMVMLYGFVSGVKLREERKAKENK